jgi:hypothetical protein
MKGETMSNENNKSNKKVKMTLLLDSDSINTIKDYGDTVLGITSISGIVRAIAKEYERKKQRGEW